MSATLRAAPLAGACDARAGGSATLRDPAPFILSNRIASEGPYSFVNEVCFHPDGETFGAAFEHADEVRFYDTRTLAIVGTLRNPAASLDRPHGLLITPRHVIVANKGSAPSHFLVFRIGDASGTPVHGYTTPYAHLAEGHSLALDGRRLVVSYCEGRERKGALVSYDYDDDRGRIIGPLDIQEQWFRRYGDAKGVAFDAAGEHVYVTFQSDTIWWRPRGVAARITNAISRGRRGATTRNGIAVFGIDRQGRFTRRPLRKKVFRQFCRLENIHLRGDLAALANPDDGSVRLHDLRRDRDFGAPLQVLGEPLVFPHGVKLSPDGTLLLVSDNGLAIVDHEVQWNRFVSPRRDGLLLFSRQRA